MTEPLTTETEEEHWEGTERAVTMTAPGSFTLPDAEETDEDISWVVPNRTMLRNAKRRFQKIQRERSRITRKRGKRG